MAVGDEIKRLISHQLQVGGLDQGDTVWLKIADDGTAVTRQEVAQVSTITISNGTKALSVGTIQLVFSGETYEVRLQIEYINIRAIMCLRLHSHVELNPQ